MSRDRKAQFYIVIPSNLSTSPTQKIETNSEIICITRTGCASLSELSKATGRISNLERVIRDLSKRLVTLERSKHTTSSAAGKFSGGRRFPAGGSPTPGPREDRDYLAPEDEAWNDTESEEETAMLLEVWFARVYRSYHILKFWPLLGLDVR
jgi:hypothetical protein